jgi:lysophospholipase L1-like esterase
MRSSTLVEVEDAMRRSGGQSAIENEGALVPFFYQLYRARSELKPVHILQFGDSHTASDDWANAMRSVLQSRFGDGGAGFTDPGRPYRGYRNFRAPSGNTDGWHTDGTVTSPGDGRTGLGGISLTTARPGEKVWIQGNSEQLELYFLQQPGGGQLTFLVDNHVESAISTEGPLGPMCFRYSPEPGWHTFEVRTISNDPVRLLGWVLQNASGITYETLGINGAQADLLNTWDEGVFGAQVSRRDPALIVFAYGTNEALSPRFTAAKYRAAFSEAVARLRRASPTTSILIVGPPDCWLNKRGTLAAFPHLDEVIQIQREVATAQRCAFWDWRQRMGGEGSKRRWVTAGMAQGDYVHFTSLGYQLVGNTLCTDLLDLYNLFVTACNQAENDRSPENSERPQGGLQK